MRCRPMRMNKERLAAPGKPWCCQYIEKIKVKQRTTKHAIIRILKSTYLLLSAYLQINTCVIAVLYRRRSLRNSRKSREARLFRPSEGMGMSIERSSRSRRYRVLSREPRSFRRSPDLEFPTGVGTARVGEVYIIGTQQGHALAHGGDTDDNKAPRRSWKRKHLLKYLYLYR